MFTSLRLFQISLETNFVQREIVKLEGFHFCLIEILLFGTSSVILTNVL